jgi:hypothetical protein
VDGLGKGECEQTTKAVDDDWGEVDTPQAYLNEAAHWLKQASQIAQRYMRLIESLDAFEDQGIGALEQWLSEDEGRSGREEPTRNDLGHAGDERKHDREALREAVWEALRGRPNASWHDNGSPNWSGISRAMSRDNPDSLEWVRGSKKGKQLDHRTVVGIVKEILASNPKKVERIRDEVL